MIKLSMQRLKQLCNGRNGKLVFLISTSLSMAYNMVDRHTESIRLPTYPVVSLELVSSAAIYTEVFGLNVSIRWYSSEY